MKRVIKATTADYYDRRFTYVGDGKQKFSGYIKYEDDPENLQFTLSEIHPYDDAEYAWAKKDSPAEVKILQDGHIISRLKMPLDLPEYDEDMYDDPAEYVDSIIDWTAKILRKYNKNIDPQIDHT